MAGRTCQVVILAAGEGTRMKSSLPKVMHKIAGLPMLGHVLKTAEAVGADRLSVVAGPGADDVAALVAEAPVDAATFVQSERLGTAHAVLAARAALEHPQDDVLILYGDTPLLTVDTVARMRAALAAGADLVVVGFRATDPSGYGRLIIEGDRLIAIREERDASVEERQVTLCNGGVIGFRGGALLPLLERIGNDNAKREYYLTDSVRLAVADGLTATVVETSETELLGANTRAELAALEAIWQNRRRRQAMDAGATLIAPETVFFAHDTELAADVTVEPNVFFGPGVSIASGALVRSFCHIEGAQLAAGSIVGPFARLRPGTSIGEGAKVGNFCEIKNADIGEGTKVNHLSYIGDASVGAETNIGAGTITCNYDGINKYHTEIGARSFIGSNSALVAPVTIGDDAYVASGSVVTSDVEDGALAIARGRQSNKPGWVERFRSRQ